jgi:hypothetical protein
MGCDIHLYKEKRVGGVWVTAEEWEDEYGEGADVPYQKRFTGRNYELFGLLSKGVRCEHEYSFEPRGIPFDACLEVAGVIARWEGDAHSTSYLYLEELKDMAQFLAAQTTKIAGMKDANELAKLQESIASDAATDWNLLYPYCKWASSPDYVNFELDIPASFAFGDSLERIIKSFDGVDGDNHRIVFFFDN